MNQLKRVLYICITLALIIFVVLSCHVTIENQELDVLHGTIAGDELSSFPNKITHIEIDEANVGSFTNNIFVPDINIPMITITVPNEDINCLEVILNQPAQEHIGLHLYWGGKNEWFSEDNSVWGKIPQGKQSAFICLPNDAELSELRIAFYGSFSLNALNYGLLNDKTFSGIKYVYDINYVFIVLFVILLIALFIFDKKIGYYSQAKTLFNNIICRIYPKRSSDIIYPKENDKDVRAVKTANLFVFLSFVFGTLIIYLCPPMSGFDEIPHFANICNISSLNIFEGKSSDGNAGFYLRQNEFDFIEDNFRRFGFSYGNNYSFDNLTSYEANYSYDCEVDFFLEDMNTPLWGTSINPMSYFIPSLGVAILKFIFGAGSVYTIYLYAKFTNLLFSIIVIREAILKTSILRNTMFLLALMPMTLYQLCSVSYDVGAISGAFLLFAYGTKLIFAESTYRVTTKDIIAVCFSCACLSACKLIYIVFVLILLSINIKKFGSIKRYILCISSVVGTCVLFYFIPTMLNNKAIGAQLSQSSNNGSLMLSHWKLIPTVLLETLSVNKKEYYHEFVGRLGSSCIPEILVNIFIFAISITVVIEICSISRLSIKGRLLFFISSLVAISGIVMSMYLNFSGFGEYVAGGVQGRYFIPAAIFIPIVFANPILCRFKYTDKIYACMEKATKCVAAAYCMLTCAIIFTAYWL